MGRTYKFRGMRTHGRGRKAGRGKGKRGGTGNAGLHKHKWLTTIKYFPNHFGRHGFKRKGLSEKINAINISDLEENYEKLLKENKIIKENEYEKIDLGELGYNKLLGNGIPKRKWKIIVAKISKGAKEKIEKLGGMINA